MNTYLDCISCFFKQALEASRMCGVNEIEQKKLLNKIAEAVPDFPMTAPPPQMWIIINKLLIEITGEVDPYKELKKKSNKRALEIYPELKKKMDSSKNSLLVAVEAAIGGNIIDYGAKNSIDLETEINKILYKEDAVVRKEKDRLFNYNLFKENLERAETILYLGDNAGEIVFDRILIEEINKLYPGKNIIFAVRGKAVINDALLEDARYCGLNKICKVISIGSDVPGTVLTRCSRDFIEIYRDADMIISKGQGNFEALSEEPENIFFLLLAKCEVVARNIGCNMGDVLLLSSLDM